MHPQPPRRSTHAAGGPLNLLVYDRWGRFGRPVLLLHGLLFDRTMWWPLAAELATACTVVAPDLPGHGDSPARSDHGLELLARDLAQLVHRLDLHRAPIVVGHATAAPLAAAFAEGYATHHVLTIDEPATAVNGLDEVIAAAKVSAVPGHFRAYAEPRRDGALLSAYASWLGRRPAAGPATKPAFPHLTDPAAFAFGLRALLP